MYKITQKKIYNANLKVKVFNVINVINVIIL